MNAVKPWREVAVPHSDVLKGTFSQAEFAADLTRVHTGSANAEYQDAALFFQRTFITEGMRLLLDSVVKRLSGQGGDPVIQLQTAFGGGKTHTMLAVYHLATATAAPADLPGISPILDAAGLTQLPHAKVAVLDGTDASPAKPKKQGGLTIRTLWGQLAWQLGGETGYAMVRAADESGTSPGKEDLAALLRACAPCVVLVDELVSYIRQFEEGKSLPGGTYGSNLSFLQTLTEAMKAVPNAVLLASLPESDKEAGGERGIAALRALEHYFARVQALWKPVATEEAFEIVRRRLFTRIEQQGAVDAVCQAFASAYVAHKDMVPSETTAVRYLDRLRSAYPIHPEVFDRLYEDWSALPGFQRTRGVLKMMAKVIHRLWKDGDSDLMILPSSLPLYDGDVRNEAVYYLATGWDPVVEKDIDGDRSEAADIDGREPLFGAVKACRRVSRTVFFGSAPSGANPAARGLPVERIVLGCLQPDQPPARFRDALKRLQDRLTYLNVSNDRYWFDTKPNLRREMEERKKRFNDRDDVIPAIREHLGKTVAAGVFNAIHVFTPSADIPDDYQLRLVVLPPGDAYTRSGPEQATAAATTILRQRGDQPRLRQNRLLFLAIESDTVLRLKDQARTLLAWRSIILDIEESRLLVDQVQAKNAKQNRELASEAFQRALRDAYRWLLVPYQRAVPGKGVEDLHWERLPLNPAATSISKEIEQVARDNEAVVTEWAPIHLHRLLKDWFWKPDAPETAALDVWQKTCQYLYMPRLAASPVFQSALTAGTGARDFYGLAYGREDGAYRGFTYGKPTTPVLDGTLLLIEPGAAAAYEAKVTTPPQPDPAKTPEPTKPVVDPEPPIGPKPPGPVVAPATHLFASVTLDPMQGALQYAKIADEIIGLLAAKPGVRLQIKLDITATDPAGYDEQTRRAVKENAKALRFDQVDFD